MYEYSLNLGGGEGLNAVLDLFEQMSMLQFGQMNSVASLDPTRDHSFNWLAYTVQCTVYIRVHM